MSFVINRQMRAEERFPGVKAKTYVSKETGAQTLQMGEVQMTPGSQIPLHTHNVEEAIIILEGTVDAVVGKEKKEMKGGTTLLAPAGVPHSLANKGNKSARLINAYPSVNVTRTLVPSKS